MVALADVTDRDAVEAMIARNIGRGRGAPKHLPTNPRRTTLAGRFPIATRRGLA